MTRKRFGKVFLKQYQLFIMILPAVAWLIVFQVIPMWGWHMAFVEYKLGRPFLEQPFVGLRYFVDLFQDYRFYGALKNTVIMSFLQICVNGFIMPIAFAIMLNEIKLMKFKRVVQSVSYLPHFVSWAVVAGIVIQSLSPSTGIINELLMSLRIISEPINFLAQESYFYGIITVSGLWKSMGWGSIIFIAAITGIDQELYEAAQADGANRLRKIWHITLPSIQPTIIIMFIIGIAGLIGTGFEAQLLLRNSLTMEKAEVLTLYALRYGIGMLRFSFGTAVGIFVSVISVTLVVITNALFRRFTDSSLF
jgi:putative aldouronate transport system permease protein